MRLVLLLLSLIAGAALGGPAAVYLEASGMEPDEPPRSAAADGGQVQDDGPAEQGADVSKRQTVRGMSDDEGFVRLGRQLIVPVVEGKTTQALVLFDLAVEVPADLADGARSLNPRLRDAFLQDLLALSYTGAFDATYTDTRVLEEVRRRLLASARSVLGSRVQSVLILDVLRQEL